MAKVCCSGAMAAAAVIAPLPAGTTSASLVAAAAVAPAVGQRRSAAFGTRLLAKLPQRLAKASYNRTTTAASFTGQQTVPMMIKGIQHAGITTSDVETSMRFYIDILGGNLVTDEIGITGTEFFSTLMAKEIDDLKRLDLKPPALCVPDMFTGANPPFFLDVYFIQFDHNVVELIHYRDEHNRTFNPGYYPPFTSPAVLGAMHIDFNISPSVDIGEFRQELITVCSDLNIPFSATEVSRIDGGHFEGWNLFYAKGPDGEQLEFNQVSGASRLLFNKAASMRGKLWSSRKKVG
eukprot:jgi/Chlat1/5065/Chrsp33S05062